MNWLNEKRRKKVLTNIEESFYKKKRDYSCCEKMIRNIIKENPTMPVAQILDIIKAKARADLDKTNYYISTSAFTYSAVAILLSIGMPYLNKEHPVLALIFVFIIFASFIYFICKFRGYRCEAFYYELIIEICNGKRKWSNRVRKK